MTPASRSVRSTKSAPRWMNARYTGSGDRAATDPRCDMATMSSSVSAWRSKVTVGRSRAGALPMVPPRPRLRPEIEEIAPLERRNAAIVLQPLRILRHESVQHRYPLLARQVDAVAEHLVVHVILVTAAQAEEQIQRALQRAREDVRPHGERRAIAQEFRERDARRGRDGDAVPGHHHEFAPIDLLADPHRRLS